MRCASYDAPSARTRDCAILLTGGVVPFRRSPLLTTCLIAYGEPEPMATLERLPSEVEDAESSPPQYEIAIYPADFTLQVLHDKWKTGDITVPPFQRGFVWNQVQASKLIESFLLGLPVPSIFLYAERRTEGLLVIDGQQRLKSVFYFLEGFFGEEKRGRRPVFRLKGLNERSPYFNKSFADLKLTDPPAAKRLLNSVMRAFVVKQLNPNDDTSIYHIFERLNSGGVTLAGQEIRNSIYTGAFNDLLRDLNMNKDWRAIFGKGTPDARMRDIELILRFFSLANALDDYQKPMKDFLSRFMSAHRNPSKAQLAAYRSVFERVSNAVVTSLGRKPFHIRAGLNAATFDAVFVALARPNLKLASDIKARFKKLLQDPDFISHTNSGTTDVDTVKKRIASAKDILLG